MQPDAESDQPCLERFRAYLNLLARLHLDPNLRAKVDLSGVVQLTLWKAHQTLAKTATEADMVRLLREILANNLADEVRKCYADKRDVNREQSLAALDRSSVQLEALLAAQQSSPSLRAERNEDLLRLADALQHLPEAQRQAVELHYLCGWTLAAIAEQMGRAKTAVAGLLHRGLVNLRGWFEDTP